MQAVNLVGSSKIGGVLLFSIWAPRKAGIHQSIGSVPSALVFDSESNKEPIEDGDARALVARPLAILLVILVFGKEVPNSAY